MSQELHNPDQPLVYQIRLKGHLDDDWGDWFDHASITQADNGETILVLQDLAWRTYILL